MLIDWFTVGAEALNFLLLMWLMRRFLYHPILAAIDAREKLIAHELADAAAKEAQALRDSGEYEKKNADLDQRRADLMRQAAEAAKAEGRRLLDEARKEADALSAKRREALSAEARNLSEAIGRRTQQEVFAVARKALADLATVSLEDRLGEMFARRVRGLDGQAKETLRVAIKSAAEPALVRSAFDLPAAQRANIQKALNETFSADVGTRFELAPDLVAGIELTVEGRKVAWSIADYLTSLEQTVAELSVQHSTPEHRAESNPSPGAEPKPEAGPNARAVSPPIAEPRVNPGATPKGDSGHQSLAAPGPCTAARSGTEAAAASEVSAHPTATAGESEAVVQGR